MRAAQQIRQGDVWLVPCAVPAEARRRESMVVAEGEVTGHAHRLVGGAEIYERDGILYVKVADAAEITHEEHAAVQVPPGEYQVITPAEYDPYERASRAITD